MDSSYTLISIIIAFYNEEDYLHNCLQSVANQTYKNIEVILVNDGSTDHSSLIAEKFIPLFYKNQLITIENSGHAEARNIGLQNASGKYVTFLDADDALEPDMMDMFLQAMMSTNADIAICDVIPLSEDGKTRFNSKWEKRNAMIQSTADLIDEMYTGCLSENVWAKMFRTAIAKEIVFEKGLWFDDRPFLLEYLFKTKTATFIDQKLLKIYRRNASITRRVLEPKRIVDAYRVFELELGIAKKYGSISEYKNRIGKHTLDVFMDTFIMQIIDEKAISDIGTVKKEFIAYLDLFAARIKAKKIQLKVKDKIALRLLRLSSIVGWHIVNRLIGSLKKQRIQAVRHLKNQ